jgi:hypothetical protein
VSTAPNWYLLRDGQRYGPLSSTQLKQMADASQILPTDMLWKEGTTQWIAAKSCKGLFPQQAVGADAPVPPVAPRNPVPRPFTGDVRPTVPRTETNCISRIEAIRDRIHDYLVEACRAEGVQALILMQNTFAPL